MWQRRTFHDCTAELRGISDHFRVAYLNQFSWNEERRQAVMIEESHKGVEILRTLALAVRSEQDYGLTTDAGISVGVLNSNATTTEASAMIRDYQPPSNQLQGFGPLSLREGLNKVAHVDPTRNGFFVDANEHDLILSGTNRSKTWIAILSLPKLCDAVEALPDVSIQKP